MSLGVRLSERLSGKKTAGNAGAVVEVSGGGCNAAVRVKEAGTLAVMAERIEVWRDVALRVAPVGRAEAETMIREIRSFPLLQGARGRAPRDLDALADTLVSFSQLPFLYPEIGEVDLNPVFLLSQGLVVGDVRVIRR